MKLAWVPGIYPPVLFPTSLPFLMEKNQVPKLSVGPLSLVFVVRKFLLGIGTGISWIHFPYLGLFCVLPLLSLCYVNDIPDERKISISKLPGVLEKGKSPISILSLAARLYD